MKQLSTIFLILIVSLQSFSRFVIEADYFVNIGYIIRNICVNKAKPQMQCNGKCYLTKKLKEQQKQEQQAPATKKIKLDTDLFYASSIQPLYIVQPSLKVEYKLVPDVALSSYPPSVFRPPAV